MRKIFLQFASGAGWSFPKNISKNGWTSRLRRKIGNDKFSIRKQVKECGSPCPHSSHIGRQSRPNLREKRRFCGHSGDVQNTASVGRFFTLWVGFPFSMRQSREIPNAFKVICGLIVWVGIFPYRYCAKENPKANTLVSTTASKKRTTKMITN